MPIMSLKNISMTFGSYSALKDLSFDIEPGEILGVAGPNGAGKSTLLNVCTGGLHATNGQVILDDKQDVTRLKRHSRCGLGIAQTFQIPTLLSAVTVGENILAGRIFGEEARGMKPAFSASTVLQITGLAGLEDIPASQADLLTRKRVMLGAALATGPRIVFMDEPLGGLNATEIEELLSIIRSIRVELDLTIVMVEHKTRALAEIADRILIINFGEPVMLDTPEIVLNDDHVVEIYLGKKHDA